jgi:hypothetical protein
MPAFPETDRLVAHVFLDAVSAYDPDANDAVNVRSVDLTIQQLGEIEGAYVASIDENDDIIMDVSDLVGGAMVTIQYLVRELATHGQSREEIVANAREYLDRTD